MTVNVIILGAGRGSRLKKFTKNKPKILLNFINKNLLNWKLEILNNIRAINNIYIVCGYKKEKLKKYKSNKIFLLENKKWKNTNMVYSLFVGKKILRNSNKLIISYGDIIYEKKVIDKLLKSKSNISVVIDKSWKKLWSKRFKNILSDAETLKIDKKNYITDIGSKPKNLNSIDGQFVGIISLNKKGIEQILNFWDNAKDFDFWTKNKKIKNTYTTDLIMGLIKNGIKIKAINIHNSWLEFDRPKDFFTYNNLYKKNKLSKIFSIK